MFSRRNRLSRRSDVLRVIKNGKKIRLPHVLVYIQKGDTALPSRHTCIVGKKVAKSAVARHRFQRWLREAVRHEWVVNGYDIVWMGLPSLASISSKKDLDRVLIPHIRHTQKEL